MNFNYTQLLYPTYTHKLYNVRPSVGAKLLVGNLGVKDTTPLSGLMHACRKTPQGALNSNCCNSLKNITNFNSKYPNEIYL